MAPRIVGRLFAVGLFLAVAAGAVVIPAAPAVAAGGVDLKVAVNQTTLDHRVRLDPGEPARVTVKLINNTDAALRVRSVRLRGSVLGLTFYSVGTVIPVQVPARESREWEVEVDLADLGSQATGLLPLEVAVVDVDRRTIASADGTADVRGSLLCAFGLFGVGLLAATAVLWATALFALARGRLPRNRWLRAVRFVWGGIGLGLVAVVSLAVLRVIAPSPPAELAFVLGAAVVSFVVGYLTPRPADPPPPHDRPDAFADDAYTTDAYTTDAYAAGTHAAGAYSTDAGTLPGAGYAPAGAGPEVVGGPGPRGSGWEPYSASGPQEQEQNDPYGRASPYDWGNPHGQGGPAL
ncbi:hypothetical protein I6A84_34575 [Frankia sp. CNm7]|uniref:Uncharacterized protein n=1 Tax=Frankia nepalensis TaxID=1836974 RepID=A0A937UQ14_9ACTN|nr:hypothetical protein [Frankia nepalensis]MBL7501193.1 hypothetical protein [Frankia nepalensis]MBL7514202.1 hypothetical protein [Frankia nepalensis]MBL7523073.1 hypothetical protein [Frankia nepalensis]MBL7631409.1 hypothetical protein [Frankia nepalensis]